MFYKYDENGYLLSPVLNGASDTTDIAPSKNLITPKFVDGSWIEGASAEEVRKGRNARREAIFTKIVSRITAISMDREDLTSPEAIRAQKEVYDNFYAEAQEGTFGTKKENEAVITAHKAAGTYALKLTKLAHAANKAIGALIEVGDDRADAALDYAGGLELTKAELTNEKLVEIKQTLVL